MKINERSKRIIITLMIILTISLGLVFSRYCEPGHCPDSGSVGAQSTNSDSRPVYIVGWGKGTAVRHSNLEEYYHSGSGIWAGTLSVTFDPDLGPPYYEFYCIDIANGWCIEEGHFPGPDIEKLPIIWILNNYYPDEELRPNSGLNDDQRAAAVQLAIWYFSDDIDISSGGYPYNVFNSARAIIDQAQEVGVEPIPNTLTLTPVIGTKREGEEYTVTATLKDQNGYPLEGETIHFEVTGANAVSGSSVTDDSGKATFTYTGDNEGEDVITSTVTYTFPVGLRWLAEECQELIMAEEAPGEINANANVFWEECGDLKIIKFYDSNENGEYDEGEEVLIPGWEFNVKGPNDIDFNVITGINATIECLPFGEYTIKERMVDGWLPLTPEERKVNINNENSVTAPFEVKFGNIQIPEFVTTTTTTIKESVINLGELFVSYKDCVPDCTCCLAASNFCADGVCDTCTEACQAVGYSDGECTNPGSCDPANCCTCN